MSVRDPEQGRGAAGAEPRRDWMGVLARARPEDLSRMMSGLADLPEGDVVRGPEIGTVMVRGRAGGVGAPFNLGEMTVTRCSLRLPCGTVGHAMVQGRAHGHARRAALLDALLQTARAEEIRRVVLAPLADAKQARERARAARAEASRVEFFTLVRGESG